MAAYFTLTLNRDQGVVTISNISRTVISEEVGYNTCDFDFQVDEAFIEYKIMIVSNSSDAHDAGTNVQIPTDGGSTNMSGTGTFASATDISSSIHVEDLKTAVSNSDGDYFVKVFIKDEVGVWSN